VVSNAQLQNLDRKNKANAILMYLCPSQRDKEPYMGLTGQKLTVPTSEQMLAVASLTRKSAPRAGSYPSTS